MTDLDLGVLLGAGLLEARCEVWKILPTQNEDHKLKRGQIPFPLGRVRDGLKRLQRSSPVKALSLLLTLSLTTMLRFYKLEGYNARR